MGLRRVIRNTIRKLVDWSQNNDYPEPTDSATISRSRSSGSKMKASSTSSTVGNNNNGMKFTVYSATGGKVIELYTYDPARDKSSTSLYIVTDKEDLGEELALIITKETLLR